MRTRRNLSLAAMACATHAFCSTDTTNAWVMLPTQVHPVTTRQSSSALDVVSSRILEDAFEQRHDNQPYMPVALLPPERNRVANSTHRLTRLQIQKAINDIKRFVASRLESDLHLTKVCLSGGSIDIVLQSPLLTFHPVSV